ncbi:MAG: WG repeat-containing protein [Muribaculaceae bacterium]|nr:WG repeat-containing protein [Muribaculaceae bacterium]
MKLLVKLLPIAVLFGLLTSCSSNSGSKDIFEQVQYLPVQLEETGNWSFMKPDGTIVSEGEFVNQPSMVINNHFTIKEGAGYSVYHITDKGYERVPGCSNLKFAGYMSNGIIPIVRNRERITYVDSKGRDKFVLEPINGKEITYCEPGFSEGLAWIVDEENHWGFIDTDGNVVIEPKYDAALPFSEGYSLVTRGTNDDMQINVIDANDKLLFKYRKTWVPITTAFHEGVTVIRNDNGRIAFLNTKRELDECPRKVRNVCDYNKKYYVFTDRENHRGVARRSDHEVIINPSYESIRILPGDKFLCEMSNENYSVRNADNEILYDFNQYSQVKYFSSSFQYIANTDRFKLAGDTYDKPTRGASFVSYGQFAYASNVPCSDFFDLGDMALNIAEMYRQNGIGKYTIGKSPAQLFREPSLYTSTSDVTFNEGSRYLWSYKQTVSFNDNISKYIYDEESYASNFVWNKNAEVERVKVSVRADIELGMSAVRAVANAFADKGYSEIRSTTTDSTCTISMQKGNFAIDIASNPSSKALLVECYAHTGESRNNINSTIIGPDGTDALAKR